MTKNRNLFSNRFSRDSSEGSRVGNQNSSEGKGRDTQSSSQNGSSRNEPDFTRSLPPGTFRKKNEE